MSTILGNPITLGGGGGAKLNIDYGTTAPSDTSKLWVPLPQKPSAVVIDNFVPYGDEFIETVGEMASWSIRTTCAVLNGEVYMLGGGSGTTTIQKFNFETGTTETLPSVLPRATYGGTAVTVGDSIYLIGGRTTSDGKQIVKFTPSTGAVSQVATLANYTWRPAVVVHEGKIYICGGFYSSISRYIYCFDPANNSLTSCGSHTGVMGCMYGFSWGKYIYLFGGGSDDESQTSKYMVKFDTETNTSEYNSSFLPTVMANGGYAQFGQYCYLFGTYSGSYSNAIFCFDAESETISQITTTLPKAGNYLAAAADGNVIYLCGGNTQNFSVLRFTVKSRLDENKLLIQHDYKNGESWTAFAGKDFEVKLYPINAYLGNSNNIAQLTNAYLHNGANWVSLDGVSMTADMLNALAVLGVT